MSDRDDYRAPRWRGREGYQSRYPSEEYMDDERFNRIEQGRRNRREYEGPSSSWGDRFRQRDDWRTPGPYTGVGPKGYRRKDETILDEVNERLTRHGQVDASNISVGVSEGEVTLNGTVRSRREKHIAEYVVESVAGVKDVYNHLRVLREEAERRGRGYGREYDSDYGRGYGRGRDRLEGRDYTLKNIDNPEYIEERYETSIPTTGVAAAPPVQEETIGERDRDAGYASDVIRGGTTRREGADMGRTSTSSAVTGVENAGRISAERMRSSESTTGASQGDTTMRPGREDQPDEPVSLWGTEDDTRSRTVPEEIRGEGMTPPVESQGARMFESESESEETAPFEGMRAEAADEPSPRGGPSAVASGPTDIARGASGSTWGDDTMMSDQMTTGDQPVNTDVTAGMTGPESISQGSGNAPSTSFSGFGALDTGAKIAAGQPVLSSDSMPVGMVKEVRENDFLVDRPMARDIYVPFHACERVENDQVFLNVTADQVNDQGWPNPPIF